MVDDSSVGSLNGPSMAHQMPLAGAIHHITAIPAVIASSVLRHKTNGYFPLAAISGRAALHAASDHAFRSRKRLQSR